ncbi:hypothetical protein Dda_6236 [Drechslerella dactyloides]|uniref:Sister chromatid cohesion protein Dcc1 n=1 Tax=Drechslerella dactyloides TaxID=74499 RepID=A0AAD6IZF0_DREDA|nr:hypothetical protein Dda_6236 [Drechslerella dactyloides]
MPSRCPPECAPGYMASKRTSRPFSTTTSIESPPPVTMSTQDASKAIPLAFAHEQTPVRLLELPPSLLSLIENSTFKGSSPVLKIKAPPAISSSSSTDGSNASPSSSSHIPTSAVLTTANETFTIRSVHSSNSIYILKPVLVPTVPDGDGDNDDADSDTEMALEDLPPKPGMLVTSICGSHLELIPSKPDTELILRSLLAEYPSPETPPKRPSDPPSKAHVLQDTPVSDAEFAQGWIDATAFELDGWAVRLSPASALLIFRSVTTIMYAASGVDNTWRTAGVDISDIMRAVDEDGELEDWPKDAIRAVLRGAWDVKKGTDGSLAYTFDAAHAAKWAGKHILLANPDKSFHESQFLSTWRDAVPADCTDHVALAALEGQYTQSALGIVRYIHGSAAAAEASSTSSSSAASKKKKWHEKFAATKKRAASAFAAPVYAPRKTAPPALIHITRGPIPLNSVRGPSSLTIFASIDAIDRLYTYNSH